MATSHTIIVAAVLCGLLVCGRADLCAPDCRGGSGYFPHPQVCNSFYQCSGETAFLQHCPAGLEFSFNSLTCDYPAQAGCTADPARECGVAAPSQKPGPTESAPTTLEARKCTPACGYSDVVFPHPQDCTKFYVCVGRVPPGRPYEKSCQSGQFFDMGQRQCAPPELSHCSARPDRACDEYLSA